jgi:segregation and condensation protein B
LYATTREFLNYFGLKSLDELPTLQEIRDLDSVNRELELGIPGMEVAGAGEAPAPGEAGAGDENPQVHALEGEASPEAPEPEAAGETAAEGKLPEPDDGEPETGKPDG